MAGLGTFRPSGRGRLLSFVALALSLALVGGSLGRAQAPAPTLTVSIKGSTTYAQPTPVPLETALLVVTPVWEDIAAKTPVNGREASGQPLFLSDLAIVLSNRSMDCESVFGPRQVSAAPEFIVVAGKVEAYIAQQGWQSTGVGKVLASSSGTYPPIAVDAFSADVQFTAQRRKSVSRDNLRGNNGRLVLLWSDNVWTADFMVRADELTAEGKLPLRACGIAARQKKTTAPLLGERRLLLTAERWGL
jgi:hypothetical protein